MADDPKNNDSAGILGDMAQAHEEQPGEEPQERLKADEDKPKKGQPASPK